MGLFSSKNKTVQQTTYDPRLMAYAYGTLNNFDNMYAGVANRFFGNSPSTFVADFSPDTLNAHTNMRDFANGSTPGDLRALATGPLSQTVGNAITGMGRVAERSAPVFAPYQALTGDEVTAQSMQAANMNAAQTQAATLSAAQVGDVANIAARQGADYMNTYMSPYLQQVVDTSLADYDVGVDRQATQARARRDAGSAFGDRAAIADAVFSADSNRGRGSLSAGLRSDAFNAAANFGMQDSNRFLEADRANQQVALQRALENARLHQAAAEANARMQQEAYLSNANFLQDANATNARFMQDAGTANARMAQEAAFKNSDTRNQFTLTNDQRLRDLEMQNFNAALSSDRLRLDALGNQAATAQGQQTAQANLYTAADEAWLRQLQALSNVGAQIDARNQALLDEGSEYLRLRNQLLSGLPVESTTTTVGKSKPSFFDIASSIAKTASSFSNG